MPQDQLRVSAYEAIRNYDLADAERTWSTGNTIRAYPETHVPQAAPWEQPPPKRHPEYCNQGPEAKGSGLCGMHLAELKFLMSTSEVVDPRHIENTTARTTDTTIAQELAKQGYQASSMGKSYQTEDGSHEYDIAPGDTTLTQYTVVEPITKRRIEWERRTKYSSGIIRMAIKPTGPTAARVAIMGIQLTPEQKQEAGRQYLNLLIQRLNENGGPNRIPSIARILAYRNMWKALRDHGRTANLKAIAPHADETFNLNHYIEGDEDPSRYDLATADIELHDTAYVWSDPIEGEPRARIFLLRGNPPSSKVFDIDPDSPFEAIDHTILEAYRLSLLRHASDADNAMVAIGSDTDLSATEWDLGSELKDDPSEVHTYLPDLEDPLSALTD